MNSNITCSKYGTASVADLLLNEMMALTFNQRDHFFFLIKTKYFIDVIVHEKPNLWYLVRKVTSGQNLEQGTITVSIQSTEVS